MIRCRSCGRTYDDESMRYCMNCGAALQSPEGASPRKTLTKMIMAAIAIFAVTTVLVMAAGQYFLHEEGEPESMVRTNSWVYDHDGQTYSLEFEIGADDLNAAKNSNINRTGSSSGTTYTIGSGSSRTVFAVEEYIVIGDTVRDLEVMLSDMFPPDYGTADHTNPNYATFLINFCQSQGTTGKGNMKYLTDLSTHGTYEYWNYPVETLDLMGGDCEDTSILTAALLRAAGFNSGIALLPGHAMAIIGTEPAETPAHIASDALLEYGEDYVKRIPYGSGGYWMLETTNSGFLPGVISGDFAFSTFHIFPSDSNAVYIT